MMGMQGGEKWHLMQCEDIAKKLINMEEKLAVDIRKYL